MRAHKTKTVAAIGPALGLFFACLAFDVRAELPPADAVLEDVGYSAHEIADIEAGKIVTADVKSVHERDLAVAFAFFVSAPPAELVNELKAGLMAKVEPNTIAHGEIFGPASPADFASLTLQPDAERRAARYVAAKPDTDLNLSADEIAAFSELGSSAEVAAVERQVRGSLLERYREYRAKGLDGIVPYAREKGLRSVAEDLRASLEAMKALQKYAPAAYAAILAYPGSKPVGAEEAFSWSHFKGHDVPTIALVHAMFVPDGDAFVVMQRQYYVSEGFNCEQAIAGLLPVRSGTVVVYSNHTSTDQVSGFGAGAKRSIGSKLLSSELRAMFAKAQNRVK